MNVFDRDEFGFTVSEQKMKLINKKGGGEEMW